MGVLEKARELGEQLAASAELKRLNSAQIALEKDERGMGLFDDYNLLQRELVKAARDNESHDRIEEIKDLLLAKQNEIDNYNITREFLEAKKDYDELMKNINDIITFAVTGEACSPDKCSSCSGGCCGSHA